MVAKHCAYGNCNSDSRYADRVHMCNVTFFKFPNKKLYPEKCLRWVLACRRPNFTVTKVTKYTYICSKHFKGQCGPTEDFPDPIPATASESQLKKFAKQRRRLIIRQPIAPGNEADVCGSTSSAVQNTDCNDDTIAQLRQVPDNQETSEQCTKDQAQSPVTQSCVTSSCRVMSQVDDAKSEIPMEYELFVSQQTQKDDGTDSQPTTKCTLIDNSDQQAHPLYTFDLDQDSIEKAIQMKYLFGKPEKSLVTFTFVYGWHIEKLLKLDLISGHYTIHISEKILDFTTVQGLPPFLSKPSELLAVLNLLKNFRVCPGIEKVQHKPNTCSMHCSLILQSKRAHRCQSCNKQYHVDMRKKARHEKGRKRLRTDNLTKNESIMRDTYRNKIYQAMLKERKMQRQIELFKRELQLVGYQLNDD